MHRRALLESLLESLKGRLLMPGSRTDYAYLSPTDPAVQAMTDFRNGLMITTPASTSIELALQQMKLSGVRFAFVVDERGALVGSVTSYDIQGEKPIRYMQSMDCSHNDCAWRDVTVEKIMETLAEWQVLERSANGDRKSTRLNSSHRCISYAVFCLKKKKKKEITRKRAQH